MIGSPRVVLGLAALTLGLAVVVAIDVIGEGDGAPPSRRLWPELDVAAVTRIRLERPGQPPVELAHAGPWQMLAPAPGPVVPAAADQLLHALATATWQRQGEPAQVTEVALRVVIDGVAVEVGPPIDAAGTRWWRRGDRAYLVEGWVATAVDRDVAGLRRSQPFPIDLARAPLIEIGGPRGQVALFGGGRAVATPTGPVALARSHGEAFRSALAGLSATAFLAEAPVGDATLTVSVTVAGVDEPMALHGYGPCPLATETPSRAAVSAIGMTCFAAAEFDRILAHGEVLLGPVSTWVEPRPVPDSIRELVLPGAVALRRAGAAWRLRASGASGELPADDDAVAAVRRALGEPWPLIARPERATAATTLRVVTDAGDEVILTFWAAHRALARGDEPIAMHLDAAAAAAIAQSVDDLRERIGWVEDAGGLDQVEIVTRADRRVLERAAVAALAPLLAAPRVSRWSAARPPSAPRRTLRLRFAAPPIAGGAPAEHVVEVWAPRGAAGCAVTLDGRPAVIATDACRALLAP